MKKNRNWNHLIKKKLENQNWNNSFLFAVKPSIFVEDLGSIVVKAGSVIRFDVRVGGEPFPEIIWFALGKPLKDNKRATIEISEQTKKTTIAIKTAERGDTGKYKLTVRNVNVRTGEASEASAEGDVVVLGAPARPQGPLEVSYNFMLNLCHLLQIYSQLNRYFFNYHSNWIQFLR